MAKFKVGDKVKLLADQPFLRGPKEGTVGTVQEVDANPFVAWEGWFYNDLPSNPRRNWYSVPEHLLELTP